MTRYVVCLDGTWNNAARAVERSNGSKVYRPTNVLKVARAVRLLDSHGNKQVTYYDTGVGSMNRAPSRASRIARAVDNMLGGMLGAGFDTNIEEAYSFLAHNWQAGDELFVFGFSRGAAQARSLVRLIGCVGGFPTKGDAYYVTRLYSEHIESCGQYRGDELWAQLNAERDSKKRSKPLDPIVPARVRYLGVWDTVLALGSRLKPTWSKVAEKMAFHVPATPPANVDRIRHAMAIDERRHDFQVESFEANHADVEQRWFAGVHSNVGGGLIEDGLANCALAWLLKQAQEIGLAVDDEFLKYYTAFPQGRASKKSFGFSVLDTMLKPWRGFRGERDLLQLPTMTLDPSVIVRLNADLLDHKRTMDRPYRPTNLLRYLALHPELRAKLNPEVQAEVDKVKERA